MALIVLLLAAVLLFRVKTVRRTDKTPPSASAVHCVRAFNQPEQASGFTSQYVA